MKLEGPLSLLKSAPSALVGALLTAEIIADGDKLILRPAAHPREVEVGLPAEDVIHDLGAALHAVARDEPLLLIQGRSAVPSPNSEPCR